MAYNQSSKKNNRNSKFKSERYSVYWNEVFFFSLLFVNLNRSRKHAENLCFLPEIFFTYFLSLFLKKYWFWTRKATRNTFVLVSHSSGTNENYPIIIKLFWSTLAEMDFFSLSKNAKASFLAREILAFHSSTFNCHQKMIFEFKEFIRALLISSTEIGLLKWIIRSRFLEHLKSNYSLVSHNKWMLVYL